jgi:hypothetical protein
LEASIGSEPATISLPGLMYIIKLKMGESRTSNTAGLLFCLQGTSPPAARLTRKILGWLMDSGKLPMYGLARRLELELAV